MAKEKKVIDASVIVKWFADENGSATSLELCNEHVNGKSLLVIPELAFLEVVNALRYKREDEDALNKVIKTLWDVQLHVERMSPFLLQKAVEVSLKYNFSVYDSVYIALSDIFNCEFYTADKALSKYSETVLI